MNHIGDSKFVLCPRGNGLDTHRDYYNGLDSGGGEFNPVAVVP
jgi:hypothetical protein